MSKKRYALSGFTKSRDSEILNLAVAVLQSMANNENFPDPKPELHILAAATLDYKTKLAQSDLTQGRIDVAIKNSSKKKLGFVLSNLAHHVNSKARGQDSKLLSTGFDISKDNTTYYVSDKVKWIKVVDGRISGEVYLSFESQSRTLLYEFCHTDEKISDEEYNWGPINRTTSSKKNLITDVVPFKLNYFRVRAINKKGTGEWSDPISFFVR